MVFFAVRGSNARTCPEFNAEASSRISSVALSDIPICLRDCTRTGFGTTTNTAPIGIGTIPTGTSALGAYFLGNIDEFRLYGAALSDNDIQALTLGSLHSSTTVRLAIDQATPLVNATAYTLNVSNLADNITPATASGALSRAFLHRQAGTLTYERYGPTIGGSTVAELARNAAFPNSPLAFLAPTISENTVAQADSSGGRLWG